VISRISGATDQWRPSLIVAIRTNAVLNPRPCGATQQYSPKLLVIVALHTNTDLDIHYCDSADKCSLRPPLILKLQKSATQDLPLFWR